MKTIVIVGALIAGNFLFQFSTTEPNWKVAAERSFFQVVAVAAVCIFS